MTFEGSTQEWPNNSRFFPLIFFLYSIWILFFTTKSHASNWRTTTLCPMAFKPYLAQINHKPSFVNIDVYKSVWKSDWLIDYIVLCSTWKYFVYVTLSVKNSKTETCTGYLWPLSREGSLSCHTWGDPRFAVSWSKGPFHWVAFNGEQGILSTFSNPGHYGKWKLETVIKSDKCVRQGHVDAQLYLLHFKRSSKEEYVFQFLGFCPHPPFMFV